MFLLYIFVCIFAVVECGSLRASHHADALENPTSGISSIESKVDCIPKHIDTTDVRFLKSGDLFIQSYNAVIHPAKMEIFEKDLHLCFLPTLDLKQEILNHCEKWIFEKDEFETLPNGSVVLNGEILEDGTFQFNLDGKIIRCIPEYDDVIDTTGDPSQMLYTDLNEASFYMGIIGSSISILALILHIIIFCSVPSLWNLPGFNMLSLSVAFLMAYSFVIIGQIPQVLGTFCIVSAIFQQYFFLAAFFCMNVMAYDVWKSFKMAIEKLLKRSETVRKRQFLWYSLYIWLCPLLITISSTIVDNIQCLPDSIKPQYGRLNTCWMTNNVAKAIFFSFPAFTLFVVNVIFFSMTTYMIKINTLNKQRQSMNSNFILYVRLAIMMGVTWLIGAVAILTNSNVVWLFFDIFNSLQGLFVFLLFTCSKKVFKHILERWKIVGIKENTNQSTLTDSNNIK